MDYTEVWTSKATHIHTCTCTVHATIYASKYRQLNKNRKQKLSFSPTTSTNQLKCLHLIRSGEFYHQSTTKPSQYNLGEPTRLGKLIRSCRSSSAITHASGQGFKQTSKDTKTFVQWINQTALHFCSVIAPLDSSPSHVLTQTDTHIHKQSKLLWYNMRHKSTHCTFCSFLDGHIMVLFINWIILSPD